MGSGATGLSSRRAVGLPGGLMAGGGGVLLLALFLPWSHQFSPAFLAAWGTSAALRGVPHDPTAWQVYSIVDVLLALLVALLVGTALRGGRRARGLCLVAVAIALAFTGHALAVPPTNGANIFDPSRSVPNYFPNSPGAGLGETLALIGLAAAAAGLGLALFRARAARTSTPS